MGCCSTYLIFDVITVGHTYKSEMDKFRLSQFKLAYLEHQGYPTMFPTSLLENKRLIHHVCLITAHVTSSTSDSVQHMVLKNIIAGLKISNKYIHHHFVSNVSLCPVLTKFDFT